MQTLWTSPNAVDFPGCFEEAFQALEHMPDAIVLLDEDGHIEFVNARAEQMFGYRREELIGEPVDILVPGHHRDVSYRTPALQLDVSTQGRDLVSRRDQPELLRIRGGIFHHLCYP